MISQWFRIHKEITKSPFRQFCCLNHHNKWENPTIISHINVVLFQSIVYAFTNRPFGYAIEPLCNSVEALWSSKVAVYNSDSILPKSCRYFLKSWRYFEKYRQDFIIISCTSHMSNRLTHLELLQKCAILCFCYSPINLYITCLS